MGTEHSGVLYQLLGWLPEQRMASGGLAELWGWDAEDRNKNSTVFTKEPACFSSGYAFTWKNTYLDEPCQMSNYDISSGFGEVEWHSGWLLLNILPFLHYFHFPVSFREGLFFFLMCFSGVFWVCGFCTLYCLEGHTRITEKPGRRYDRYSGITIIISKKQHFASSRHRKADLIWVSSSMKSWLVVWSLK